MRNFLVRLAQRSIGQVPVVRSRAMLAPPIIGADGGVAMVEVPAAPARPPAMVAGDQSPPVASVVHGASERPQAIPQPVIAVALPQAEIHAIPTTRLITEVIERPLPPMPTAPIEQDGRGTKPPAAVMDPARRVASSIQPAVTLAIQPAAPAPIAVPDLAAPAPAQPPTAKRDDPAAAIDGGRLLRPAPAEIITPRHEPLDPTEPIGNAAALIPASRDLPPLLGLDTVRPAPAPAKTPSPSEERIVQVRIGAIEIHALVPPLTPPAPGAASMQRSLPRGGFDEFARLRSYAPWEW
jgi:hypothetical protein